MFYIYLDIGRDDQDDYDDGEPSDKDYMMMKNMR